MTTSRYLLAVSALAVLALGGCASGENGRGPLITPLAQYALRVEPGVDRIALAVHETGVSQNQNAHLHALAGRFREAGAGWIRVEGPNGGDPVAIQHAWAVKAALEQAGVPGDRIQVTGYDGPDPRAPVLAGFEVLRRYIPNCAAELNRPRSALAGGSASNLGCAVNANLAAQIADPRDIAQPRAMSPVDSGRSAVVFAAYREGELTAAPQEDLVGGRISRAVE